MKKWLVGTGALLLILLAGVYSLVPSKISVVNTASFTANANAVSRSLIRQEVWDEVAARRIRIAAPRSNGVSITTFQYQQVFPGQVIVLPLTDTSCSVRWQTDFPEVRGPLARISAYRRALGLKEDINDIIQRVKTFCEKDSNTYGFHIMNESTIDTFLLATRFTDRLYPSVEEVYGYIGKLKKAASDAGLEQTSFPMLNVTINENNTYKCMVALPVNKMINDRGKIFFTRMEPGRFITAETRGGIATVQRGHQMVQTYIHDYKKLLMAMPFEHLLTDRRAEKDTAKWITKLYYPVP